MRPSRRALLAAPAALAFGGLALRANAQDAPSDILLNDPYTNQVKAYGPLIPDPAGLFDLPEGFSYTILSKTGDRMDDGLLVPANFDGMGCFSAGGDRVVLVRNHELKADDFDEGAFGAGHRLNRLKRGDYYDHYLDGRPLVGGTTNVVYDLRRREVVAQHLSLAGTAVNCSGGHTPWNSWLSCEETVQLAGGVGTKDHGYVFEVPSGVRGLAAPVPITGMGRFRHEAVCIDPRTGVAYLTEDTDESLLYRFVPEDRRRLHNGGRLQVLGFEGRPGADSRNWTHAEWTQGERRKAVWIDIDGVDNPHNDLRLRGRAAGAAVFARGEGIFFGDGELFFTCTSGGPTRLGQIIRYIPSPHEGGSGERDEPGQVELFLQPMDKTVMEMADNIAISPWGHLIVCEDKSGGATYLRAVTPEGRTYALGRNPRLEPGETDETSELAGACFSPDGATLFVNIYTPGITLAIVGPWSRFDGGHA